ncbi:hypothetical protein O4J56_17890 [Nocardiopsis sp. RSe5-2]|uniref:Uncharacterized protein n=1 Tax=Nocardiopsis endophytica TaxID=3018445 RepID=A0ABT4U6E9_9ACTN|nr:hypothetical protein [Nocardiopsis endophytica]MDA2812520.1 hypothetical protein [Nocardiopsis endophytica]
MATIAASAPAPAPVRDDEQNAELARLIRRLAAVRPEIVNSVPGTPSTTAVPAPRRPAPEPPPLFPPHLTAEDFPRPKEERDRIAHLRAICLGRMRPGDHWPAHADDRFRVKMRRPLLRHRIGDALHRAARPARMVLSAANAAAGASLLYWAGATGILPL